MNKFDIHDELLTLVEKYTDCVGGLSLEDFLTVDAVDGLIRDIMVAVGMGLTLLEEEEEE